MAERPIDRPDGGTSHPLGRSLRLYLVDGTPQGLVTAELINWTGKAIAAPRARLPDLLKRSEASRTGIYILLGPDPDRSEGVAVYIGEADNIAARFRIHLRSEGKDFFDRVVILVSTDDNLTKAHARYLESQLIRLVREAGAVSLINDTHPDFRLLPEADKADMEIFLNQLKLVLPILGFDLFRRPDGQGAGATPADGETIFTFSPTGASATARETDDGFVVLAESTARRGGTDTFPAGYRALRDNLVRDGKLVDGPTPELHLFAADVAFASPSAAASVVAARSAAGPREWRVKATGQTYRDWRAAKLEDPNQSLEASTS